VGDAEALEASRPPFGSRNVPTSDALAEFQAEPGVGVYFVEQADAARETIGTPTGSPNRDGPAGMNSITIRDSYQGESGPAVSHGQPSGKSHRKHIVDKTFTLYWLTKATGGAAARSSGKKTRKCRCAGQASQRRFSDFRSASRDVPRENSAEPPAAGSMKAYPNVIYSTQVTPKGRLTSPLGRNRAFSRRVASPAFQTAGALADTREARRTLKQR